MREARRVLFSSLQGSPSFPSLCSLLTPLHLWALQPQHSPCSQAQYISESTAAQQCLFKITTGPVKLEDTAGRKISSNYLTILKMQMHSPYLHCNSTWEQYFIALQFKGRVVFINFKASDSHRSRCYPTALEDRNPLLEEASFCNLLGRSCSRDSLMRPLWLPGVNVLLTCVAPAV